VRRIGKKQDIDMEQDELSLLRQEVAVLRRASKAQRLLLALGFVAIAGLAATTLDGPHVVAAQSTTDAAGILHVRGLVVEDPGGHERVRLGAPLPDPIRHGVRIKRQGSISGLLISDSNGDERGGYFTGDQVGEAVLTLDSEDEQQMRFLANPKGGVNFDIYDSKGNEAEIMVFPTGPRLIMTKAKERIFEFPPFPGK
jgi:hypothetical protein